MRSLTNNINKAVDYALAMTLASKAISLFAKKYEINTIEVYLSFQLLHPLVGSLYRKIKDFS